MMNSGWEIEKLGDLCSVITKGTTPTTLGYNFQKKGINFIKVESISEGGRFIKKKLAFINQEAHCALKRSQLQEKDILFSIAGAIGRTAIVNRDILPANTNQALAIIRMNSQKTILKYLYWYIRSSEFQNYSFGKIVQTAQANVSLSELANIPIKLPLLETQQKIATILSNYDNLIENNEKRIKLLEQIAKRIYEEWFVNFKFPGHENVKMIDSKSYFGKIPEGWVVKQIANKFNVVLGGTPARAKPEYWGGNISWINSGKVNKLRIIECSEKITDLGLKKSSTKMMPIRTTVLAITGATLGQISLTEKEVCANQSVVGVYDENNLYSEFLYLKIAEIIKKIILKAGGGAQQHINKENVSETEIVIPDKEIIMKFNSVIRPLFDLLANLMIKNLNLRKTRDLLLPKLISGKVDVSKLNIKIPEIEV